MTNMAPVKDPQKEYIDRMTAVLASLAQTPGWEMFVDVLTDIRVRKVAQLLAIGTKDTFDFDRGVIAGIDLLLSLPGIYKNRTNPPISN